MPRTIRVRIAVAVTETGAWNSCGWRIAGEPPETDAHLRTMAAEPLSDDLVTVHWVEADIPIPESVTVEGEVTT